MFGLVPTYAAYRFVRDFHASIATGRPLRLFYRFRKSDDTYAVFEAHGHPHIADASPIDHSSSQSVCKGLFMMARPYPTRNAALLDSFLEHKIENERLTKRIAELRKEEYEDQQRQRQQQSLRSDGMTNTSHGSSFGGGETPLSLSQGQTQAVIPVDSMPPPAKPISALTRQNLDRMEASNSARIEGIRDKMARFDGPSHMDTIEILTGLRYREGERSKGISTGDTSPALIRGDAGVPIPVDKESRQSSDKKKKQKIADEYVCTDCGTLDSPEWRKGPKGPKTLCNACGLRWAKFVPQFQFEVVNLTFDCLGRRREGMRRSPILLQEGEALVVLVAVVGVAESDESIVRCRGVALDWGLSFSFLRIGAHSLQRFFRTSSM